MKNLKLLAVIVPVAIISFTACTKDLEQETVSVKNESGEVEQKAAIGVYVTYTIAQGAHYANNSPLTSIKTSEMKFGVMFDSSAVYTTVDPGNQSDINKLYGFSEGFNNQYNSARMGWAWYRNALNLYAYVYVKGVRSFKKITGIAIGAENTCSIKVSGASYIFTVNGISVTMPRGLKTVSASGLQQYPYFGGNETAPHTIKIKIKSL